MFILYNNVEITLDFLRNLQWLNILKIEIDRIRETFNIVGDGGGRRRQWRAEDSLGSPIRSAGICCMPLLFFRAIFPCIFSYCGLQVTG